MLCFLFLGSIYKQYQEKILYLGSTYLIFLIFFAASIWKFSLSDFRSGNFLEYTFLSGHIFDLYAVILESLSFSSEKWQEVYGSILMPNRENINILQNNVEGGSITLLSSERIVMASKILTILSLVTQATISLSLLLYMVTKKRVFAYIMHSFICEFIIFAYYPTQVLGFGMLLCILGIAHSHFTVPKFKIIYLGLILLLLLYDLPLSGWLMNNDIPYITMF